MITLTLDTAKSIIHIISMLLAYIIVVPIAGYSRAWMAKKMGDDTPEELGFLTLDPWHHVDFFGILCLLLFNVGWGKNSPVNPANIIYSSRGWLKVSAVFFADATCYFFIALVALTANLILVGPIAITLPGAEQVAASSLVVSIGSVLNYIIYWTIFLSAIFFLIRTFELLMVLNPRWFAYYMAHNQFFLMVLYLIVIFFLTRPVQIVLSLLIAYLATGIVHLIGIF
jgi:hypothetical protein